MDGANATGSPLQQPGSQYTLGDFGQNYGDSSGLNVDTTTSVGPTTATDGTSSAAAEGETGTTTGNHINDRPANLPGLQPFDPAVDPDDATAALNHLFDPAVLAESPELQNENLISALVAASQDSEAVNAVVTDPHIIALAQAANVPPGVMQAAIRSLANRDLNKALASLPPDVAAQIRFGLAFPESIKNLPPAVQALLKEIQEAVMGAVQQQFPMEGWEGPAYDLEDLQEKLVIDFDNSYEKALQDAIASAQPPLTQEQIAQLRLLHYAPPGVKLPTDPALVALAKSIQGVATAALQQKYGFASGWTPPVNADYFKHVLNGAFINAFGKAAGDFKPPLTKEQADNVNKYADAYFANADDPSIPADVKGLIAKIVAAANAAVIKEFGLDPAWTASITALHPPGLDLATFGVAKNAIANLKDRLELAKKMANDMPNSPEKQMLLNYLMTVGIALNKLQEGIYAMQSGQVKTSSLLNALRLEIQQSNIDHMKYILAQIQEQGNKIAKVIPLEGFNDVMGKIMLIGFACVCGPVALAMAIAYVAKPDIYQPAFEKVQSGCEDLGKAIGGPGGEEFGKALGAMTCLCMACIMACGNPMLGISLVCKDSKSINNMAMLCGANENEQKIAVAVFEGVAQIGVAIGMAVLSGGAGSGVALMGALQALNISAKAAQVTMKVAQVIMTCFQISMTVMQGYNQAVEYNNNLARATIAQLKGQLEKNDENAQAMLLVMKQLVNQLLEALGGNSSWLVQIGNLQGQKWTKANQISSELFS